MILVIGSTGMLGSEVCRLLISENLPVRAMVRTTSDVLKREKLIDLGAQLVSGDLRDKSKFLKILEGITTVIATVSSMPFSYAPGENDIVNVDEDGMINMIDAATKAGVRHFIYTSFSKNLDLDFPLRNSKRKVEKHLQASGMNYTILRPGYFMESWLSPMVGFDAVNGKVNILGLGTNPVAYISIKDVAKFTVECISNSNAVNSILELGGPDNLSQLDAVKVFEEVLDKKVEIQFVPEYVIQNQLDSATDPMQKSFAGLMLCMANGDYIEMKETLTKFPIELTSLKEFAHKQVQVIV